MSAIEIRPYRPGDSDATLAVFLAAITKTASADYTPGQLDAWARPARRTLPEWNRGMLGRDSYVAVIEGEVAGFSDVSSDGHIHMMFVSPRHQRRGVASALLTHLECRARQQHARSLHADVSITARPLFERHGFAVDATQERDLDGVTLTNYAMSKPLPA